MRDTRHLSLELRAGGLWREDWAGGSVAHGSVLLVQPPQQLRLDAPFGPLQGVAIQCVWTIRLEEDGAGTKVTFDIIANGAAQSGLDKLAAAVDFVQSEAMANLVAKVSGK